MIVVNFDEPLSDAGDVVALLVAALVVTLAVALGRRLPAPWGTRAAWGAVAASGVACAVGLVLAGDLGTDEVEHLHAAWLVSRGQTPFADFFQNHSPVLWYVLAPILVVWPADETVLWVGRVAGVGLGGVATALAAAFAARLWRDRDAGWMAAALVIGSCWSLEFQQIRPENLSNPIAVGAVVAMASAASARAFFVSGALFGAAMAVNPKLYPFAAVATAVVVTTPLSWPDRLRLLGAHLGGAVAGAAPLFVALGAAGLADDFVYWVFGFNGENEWWFGGKFVIVPLLAAAFGLWRLRDADTHAARVGGFAIAAAMLVLLLCTAHKSQYGGQTATLLGAAYGAGAALTFARWLVDRRAVAAVGLLAALGAFGTGRPIYDGWGDFRAAVEQTRLLVAMAGPGPVVTVTPTHPIVTDDATSIYLHWQLVFWSQRPELRGDYAKFAAEFEANPPTLVLDDRERADGKYVFDRLRRANVLTRAQEKRLLARLEADYVHVRVGKAAFWVREDRPIPRGVRVLPKKKKADAEPPAEQAAP